MADIDDLSDSEQYNDDFVVGTPSPDKNSKVGVSGNNDVDDEQHAQKVNGQMEQLKMTVKDLEEQLESGKFRFRNCNPVFLIITIILIIIFQRDVNMRRPRKH